MSDSSRSSSDNESEGIVFWEDSGSEDGEDVRGDDEATIMPYQHEPEALEDDVVEGDGPAIDEEEPPALDHTVIGNW